MKYRIYLKETLFDGRMNFFFFLIVVFTLPMSRKLFTLAIWPWLLTWFIEGDFKDKFRQDNIKRNFQALIFLPGLFLLMLISLLWSSDKANGLNQLGIQASMIIFPFFMSFSNDIYRKRESFKKILITYCLGILITTIYLLIKAVVFSVSFKGGSFSFNPIINGWENVFFFSQFSYLIHPTYLGLMVLLAIAIALIDIKMKRCCDNKTVIKVLFVFFLFIIIFLISSRAIILASILLGLCLLQFYITRTRIKILSVTVLISIFILLLSLNPRIKNYFNNYKTNGNESLENLDNRLIIWKSSFILIKDKTFSGVGIGDVKNQLKKVYNAHGYKLQSSYNAHNQYLEQWLTSGIFSLIFLFAGLLIPLFSRRLKISVIYYSSFLIITGFVFLFESILCRFLGVAFFSIFYTFLTTLKSEQQIID